MEKENKKLKNIIIGVLVLIIIILLLLVYKFYPKKNNELNQENIVNTTILSDNEASAIVLNSFNNKIVRHAIDNYQLTYCSNKGNETYTEKDLGLMETTGWIYYECNEFSSYNDLINNVKNYFSDKYFDSNLNSKTFIKETETVNNTTVYYYYVKDDKLYVASNGKGSNMDKYTLIDATCNDITVTSSSINATVTAKWNNYNNTEYVENIELYFVKENNLWKIDSYNVK